MFCSGFFFFAHFFFRFYHEYNLFQNINIFNLTNKYMLGNVLFIYFFKGPIDHNRQIISSNIQIHVRKMFWYIKRAHK